MPRVLALALLGWLAFPTTGAASGQPPESPIALVEHHLAFLVSDPQGPAVLEVIAFAPTNHPVEPRAFAAAVQAAAPSAIPLARPPARAAYVLDRVRWRDPRIPWWYNPTGSPAALDSASAESAVRDGAAAWRFAGGTPVEFLAQGQSSLASGCAGDPTAFPYARDGVNVVGWGDIPGGYLGYTCWWRGPSLVEGTPFFELLEFDIVLSPAYPYTRDVLRALALHEFGHALGLGHSDQCPGAAMCERDGALVFPEPRQDDLAGLVALYGRSMPPSSLPARARLPLLARD